MIWLKLWKSLRHTWDFYQITCVSTKGPHRDVVYRGVGYRGILDEFQVCLVLVKKVDAVVSQENKHRVVVAIRVAQPRHIHLWVKKLCTSSKKKKTSHVSSFRMDDTVHIYFFILSMHNYHTPDITVNCKRFLMSLKPEKHFGLKFLMALWSIPIQQQFYVQVCIF